MAGDRRAVPGRLVELRHEVGEGAGVRGRARARLDRLGEHARDVHRGELIHHASAGTDQRTSDRRRESLVRGGADATRREQRRDERDPRERLSPARIGDFHRHGDEAFATRSRETLRSQQIRRARMHRDPVEVAAERFVPRSPRATLARRAGLCRG